ncbi:MAG: 2-hydroxyacid dehydrogenase [Candidatus Hodarchaeota archaeon]
MKVLFTHRVSSELKEYYQTKIPSNVDLIFPDDLSNENLFVLAAEANIAVGYKFSRDFLEEAKNLSHIQVPWTGSETLDFELLKEYPSVTVSNSHSNSLAIAEHAIALLLAASKRLAYSDSHMRKGDWTPRYEKGENTNGYWVSEKTLGVIGFGAIGEKVAKILKSGFNMKVLAIKRNPDVVGKNEKLEFIGGPKDLKYVLKESDFILISLPMTKETEGLIGREELEQMKDTAILVNISRGSIIDETSLFLALKEKKIAAAGLDVWYNYPKDRTNPTNVFQNHPFEELDNVVMTPHAAFKVVEREKIFTKDVIENILLVSSGKNPKNQLNLELGY